MAKGILHQLSKTEKAAFRLHMIYSAIEGIILGVLALNEYVFIYSLKGTNYQLAFLFQFSMVVFVFLFIFNQLRKRIGNKKRMLRVTGLLTRLPLILRIITIGLYFPLINSISLNRTLFNSPTRKPECKKKLTLSINSRPFLCLSNSSWINLNVSSMIIVLSI